MRTKQKELQVNTRKKEGATEREKVKEQTLKTNETRPQLLNHSALFLIRSSWRVSHLINTILPGGRMVQQTLSGTSITAQSRLKHEDTRVNKRRGNINRSPSAFSAARRPAESSEWASYLTKNKPESNLSFNGNVKRSTILIKTN